MKNTLSINNGIAMLLVCLDDGSNSFFINDTEIPSSSWVGSGTYTYTSGGVTFVINKVADTDGNIMLVQVDTYEYSLIKKEDQQSTYGLSISGTTLSIIENGGSSSVTIPKGDKGDTGNGIASTTLNADYTLTITYTDGTSWTSTPIRGATGSTGPQGPKGETGNTGAAAGFGTPTASVDSNTGTPSVSITSSGPDTAKIFNFEFHNLKGEKGEKGDTGSISNLADATVDTIDTVTTEYPEVAAGDKVSTLFGKIKKFLNDLKSKKVDKAGDTMTGKLNADGGISSSGFTASKILVTDANKNIVSSAYEFDIATANTTDTWIPVMSNSKIQHCLRELKNAVGDLGWGSGNDNIATKAMLAFWNGAYSGTGSNLAYCNKGAFGDMATKSTANALTLSYKSGTYVNSLTNGAVIIPDASGSFGSWICGPTKNGRIAISTYQASDDVLYIGYGERGRTQNSYARQLTWNGANGNLSTGGSYYTAAGKGLIIGTHSMFTDLSTSSCVMCADNGTFVRKYSNTNTANNITALGFINASSKLVKENVKPITEDYARKILELDTVSFDYIDKVGGEKDCVGMIAEDVLDIMPNLVVIPENYNEEETREKLENEEFTQTLSLDYAKFVPPLIKLVQMQQKQIDSLQDQINELKDMIKGGN